MTLIHHKVVQAALAGLLLTAFWPACTQSVAATKGAPIHGDAIDAAQSPTAAPSATIAPAATGGVVNAGFETLASYNFNVPDMPATNHPPVSRAEKQIPAAIKKLDGEKLIAAGM